MSNVKRFNQFVNELKGSTYKSAAEKMVNKGQTNRAKIVDDHRKNKLEDSRKKEQERMLQEFNRKYAKLLKYKFKALVNGELEEDLIFNGFDVPEENILIIPISNDSMIEKERETEGDISYFDPSLVIEDGVVKVADYSQIKFASKYEAKKFIKMLHELEKIEPKPIVDFLEGTGMSSLDEVDFDINTFYDVPLKR